MRPNSLDTRSGQLQLPAFLPDDDSTFVAEFPDVQEFGIRVNDFAVVHGQVTEFVSSTSGSGAVTELAGISEDPAFYRFLARGFDGPESWLAGQDNS